MAQLPFEKIEIKGLGDEVRRTVFARSPTALLIAVGRYHDDRQIGASFLDLTQQRKAIHAGHIDVGEDDDELRLDAIRELVQRILAQAGDLYGHRKLIVELAEKNSLPTMGAYREHVEAGGLMAYGINIPELLGHMPDDVHEILKGAKPGDIPIYQATKFEFVINLKTAKALGLTLPPALLARVDEVIE